MNVSPKLLSRTTKTPIKKTNISKKTQSIKNLKDENKIKILTIINNEFNKLDEEEIKSSFNSVFKNQTIQETTLITGLLSKINEVKKNILDKIKEMKKNNNPLNNSMSFSKELNNNEKINNIQNELKKF